MSNLIEKIKLFQLSTQMAERDLDAVEDRLKIDLGRQEEDQKDQEYYPQIEYQIRQEAVEMSNYYEVFYSLENTIRALIGETLEDTHGVDWWNVQDVVPDLIKQEVTKNMRAELSQAVAPRSDAEIDYTTFGQLGDLVRHRWVDFEDIFRDKKGFNKVMTSLNVLRGPIAHCCPLPENEAVRLRLTVEDWFRLLT